MPRCAKPASSVDRTEHSGDPILELVVAPAAAGKFTVRLNSRTLWVSFKPFLDAARALMAEGADPAAVLAEQFSGEQCSWDCVS
jgi:hypothetical protein